MSRPWRFTSLASLAPVLDPYQSTREIAQQLGMGPRNVQNIIKKMWDAWDAGDPSGDDADEPRADGRR